MTTTRKAVTLRLSQLTTDAGTQSREQLDPATAREYAEALAGGAGLPPIEAVSDGRSYWPWDGFHRVAAHQEAGRGTIEAFVTAGTVEDARWLALSANKTHGLKRSNEDKQKSVRRALAMRPDLSDHAIADHCGVNDKTVASARKAMTATAEIPQSRERVGRDGRTYKVAPKADAPAGPRANGRPPAERPDAPPPEPEATPLDAVGMPVPERMRRAFAAAARIDEVVSALRQAQKVIGQLAAEPGGEALRRRCELREANGRQSFRLDRLHTAVHDLLSCRPYASACPHCHARHPGRVDKGCGCCLGAGWVTKDAWQAAPEDYRAGLLAGKGAAV